jgi:3-deoxy-D-manno-octulosonic-acid transferase
MFNKEFYGFIAFRFYRFLSIIVYPLLWLYFGFRLHKNKETKVSFWQKMGLFTIKRPHGTLLWFHAASVGESKSILPIIEQLTSQHKITVLITTSTISAANFLKPYISSRGNIIHQFLVIDIPWKCRAFYQHWSPTVGVFVDSELWPNLLYQATCPMVLINARISPKSFRFWKNIPSLFRFVANSFKAISPTTIQDKNFLIDLGINPQKIHYIGNLKSVPQLQKFPSYVYDNFNNIMPKFKLLCVSTHHGEEEAILRAFKTTDDICLIIAPRHPERAKEIADCARKLNYEVILRSQNSTTAFSPHKLQLFIVDRIGELGLWYTLSDLVFVGGSFISLGGHNIIEPTQYGKAVMVGPNNFNFSDSVKQLHEAGALKIIADADELKTQTSYFLTHPTALNKMHKKAAACGSANSELLSKFMKLILEAQNDIKSA